MLYQQSRRLWRNTSLGFLGLSAFIVVQMLFGGWGLHRMYSEMSVSLVSLSDTQLESLELKTNVNTLRKLEKDMLLSSGSPARLGIAKANWHSALEKTHIQIGRLNEEIQEGLGHVEVPIEKLKTAIESYAEGVSRIIDALQEGVAMTPQEADMALKPSKAIILDVENELDRVVEEAEEQEQETLKRLEALRDTLLFSLGGIGLLSLLTGAVLGVKVTRSSLAIGRTLEHQALHDPLTGLLNRRGLDNYLSADTGRGGVLAYIDLDRFKLVNDLCGHSVGDKLLTDLTQKLSVCCEKQGAVIARVGGDEFAVWLSGPGELVPGLDLAGQIVRLVEQHPFTWLDQPMHLGASVGLALAPPGFTPLEIVARSDAACRLSKKPGRAKVLVYEDSDPDLTQAREEERWAARLPQLIEEGRFCLYGQRILPLQPGNGKGHIEILIRGLDEQGRPIPPGKFLPAAERFGLMPRLDRWVIETLLASGLREDCEYAVNLSGQTMMDKAYLPRLEALLRESGKARQLSFEITESAAMTNVDTAREYIRHLKALGCRFALDDFGSGFSSFAYLRDLEVDFLKIDGSLIRILGRHESDTELTRAIVQMAKTLGLKTIAEFVETPAIAEQLREMGVDYGQGYGLHKPEPLSAIRPLAG